MCGEGGDRATISTGGMGGKIRESTNKISHMALKNTAAGSASLSGAGKAGGKRPSAEVRWGSGEECESRLQVNSTPSPGPYGQCRSHNKEASGLLPSPASASWPPERCSP